MDATPYDIDAQASPCIGVCRLDPATGYCEGCGRTGEEIAAWAGATDAERRAVWHTLPGRLAELGRTLRRLPWSEARLADFVDGTLRPGGGVWVLGVHGAVGEFVRDPAEPLERADADGAAVAETPRAALRLALGAGVCALGVTDEPGGERLVRVVLALPKASFALPVAHGFTPLGPDRGAIRHEARDAQLYDVGLGRGAARFCLRTADPALARELERPAGLQLSDYLREVGPAVVEASPTRVVETGLGRVEIDAPIPRPGGRSPDGPHTHLLPDLLATGRDAPPDIELPAGYLPGAIFYPAAG